MYRELCDSQNGFFTDACADEVPEDVMEEDARPPEDCVSFLKNLQSEHQLLRDHEGAEGEAKDMPNEIHSSIRDVPDAKQLQDVLESSSAKDPFRLESSRSPKNGMDKHSLPSTLLEALALQERGGCVFNGLFRLVVRLRSARGGSDLGWVKNPRSCCRASRGLNWHQLLGLFLLHFLKICFYMFLSYFIIIYIYIYINYICFLFVLVHFWFQLLSF